MERRTFMKAAVIAAATPAAAFAPVRAETLADVVAQHAEVVKLQDAAWDALEAMYHRDDRPRNVNVTGREMDPREWLGNSSGTDCGFPKDVEAYFDQQLANVKKAKEHRFCNTSYYNARMAELPLLRASALRLLAERENVMCRWEATNGIQQMQAERDALDEREEALEEKILNWPCQTAEEVSLKIAAVNAKYSGTCPERIWKRLCKNLMGA